MKHVSLVIATAVLATSAAEDLHGISIRVLSSSLLKPVASAEVALTTQAGHHLKYGKTDSSGLIRFDDVPGYDAILRVGYTDCPRVREEFVLSGPDIARNVVLPPTGAITVRVMAEEDLDQCGRPIEEAYVMVEHVPEQSMAHLTNSIGATTLCVLADREFTLLVRVPTYHEVIRRGLRVGAGQTIVQEIALVHPMVITN